MKYIVPKCLNCNGKLSVYEEHIYSVSKKINKNGTISKRKPMKRLEGIEKDFLCCDECFSTFYYDVDKKGRICDLEEID
jgi:hypothetical protein